MNSSNIEVERAKKRLFNERIKNELDTLDENSQRYIYLKKIIDDQNKV